MSSTHVGTQSNLVPRAAFLLTSGRKTRALGASISGMRYSILICRLRLRSEPDNQNSVIFHCYFKMDAPRSLVSRPLVKGNEALETRLHRTQNVNPFPTSHAQRTFWVFLTLWQSALSLLKVPSVISGTRDYITRAIKSQGARCTFLGSPSYPASLFLWPAVGNQRPWKDPIWSPKKADFRLNCACLTCIAHPFDAALI